MLELHEWKHSRAVLRGGGGGDVTSLPDQARLERVALIASSHQRMIDDRLAASRRKKRLDLSARIAWLGAY
jgi:hypothetical protein